MSTIGYGPTWRIDGPRPLPPLYGLLQAADAPAAGVTVVPDADPEGIERWINGVSVYPYPPGPAHPWDACAVGTYAIEKDTGEDLENPLFSAMVVYLAERCTTVRIPDQQAFKARALLALNAVQSAAIAKEFMGGHVMPANPHLADGNGTFPLGNTATSPLNALSLLEGEIANSGKLGLIHMTPAAATVCRAQLALDDRTGVLRTINGNVVIPDSGYWQALVDGVHPDGKAGPGTNQEWMFATGPIEIRQSDMFTIPDKVSEAVDRGTGGADTSTPNSIVYRAERYFVVDWDTQVQSAVLADRCRTTC